MGKVASPKCLYCGEDSDDAYHTFFACTRWHDERTTMESALGTICSPDSIVEEMLKSEENWNAVGTYVEEVLRLKKNEEEELEQLSP